ncbi:MAG: hypothetical protein KAS90_06595 [Candidatus Aenigmarchaeota archaeon]|nr:hypothetical protein [Candidatus Aenigmarchaeota archaeon]
MILKKSMKKESILLFLPENNSISLPCLMIDNSCFDDSDKILKTKS